MIYYRVGIGGNYYITSYVKEVLIDVCKHIGKSTRSIYYNSKYNTYVVRVKNKKHKDLIKNKYKSIK